MRILLLTNNVLLGDVLRNLLSTLTNHSVHQILQFTLEGLQKGIDLYQPDVIVLEEGLADELSLNTFSQLRANGSLQVVVISPDHNSIRGCIHFSLSANETADLLAIIEKFQKFR